MTNGYILFLCTTDTRGKSQTTSKHEKKCSSGAKRGFTMFGFHSGKNPYKWQTLRFCLALRTFYLFLLKVPLVMQHESH